MENRQGFGLVEAGQAWKPKDPTHRHGKELAEPVKM